MKIDLGAVKIEVVDEIRVWYRSAMVWFLSLAGVMEIVHQTLPQVSELIPSNIYDGIMKACLAVGFLSRFIKQPKMHEVLEKKKVKSNGN